VYTVFYSYIWMVSLWLLMLVMMKMSLGTGGGNLMNSSMLSYVQEWCCGLRIGQQWNSQQFSEKSLIKQAAQKTLLFLKLSKPKFVPFSCWYTRHYHSGISLYSWLCPSDIALYLYWAINQWNAVLYSYHTMNKSHMLTCIRILSFNSI